MRRVFFVFAVAMLCRPISAGAQTLSYSNLVSRLTDLEYVATLPAVDLPFTGYFDKSTAPFTHSALVHTTAANGWNNYTPIPYQTSCKIVAAPGWGDYFQFTYGTFPSDTRSVSR